MYGQDVVYSYNLCDYYKSTAKMGRPAVDDVLYNASMSAAIYRRAIETNVYWLRYRIYRVGRLNER